MPLESGAQRSNTYGPHVPREDVPDVGGRFRYIPGPAAEPAVRVDGLDPFGEEPVLGQVLVAVLALGLEHQHVTRCEPDEEIGAVFPHHAAMDVEHLEAEMVVLHPGGHLGGAVEDEGLGRFPRAVEDAEIDVTARRGLTRC